MKSDYETVFQKSPKFHSAVLQPMRLALMLQEQNTPHAIEMANGYNVAFEGVSICKVTAIEDALFAILWLYYLFDVAPISLKKWRHISCHYDNLFY